MLELLSNKISKTWNQKWKKAIRQGREFLVQQTAMHFPGSYNPDHAQEENLKVRIATFTNFWISFISKHLH